jgi:predicted transcriptional regulator
MSEVGEFRRRDVLFSVRPEYAEQIVEGQKTVELRRRFTNKVAAGSLALIYCTSPTKAIIGVAVILGVECLPIRRIWAKHGPAAKIDRLAFDNYFCGCKEGFAILLGRPRRFEKQLRASRLHQRFGFVAPQSFIYLPKRYYSLLEHDQLQASH